MVTIRVLPDLTKDEELYTWAVDQVALAEQDEAESFLARKNSRTPVLSDWEARAMALLDTHSNLTKTRAMAEVYRARLYRSIPDADSTVSEAD